MQGYPPHIIILLHPWEFSSEVSSLTYCSETNYEWLGNLIDRLAENFNIETATITEMTSQLTERRQVHPQFSDAQKTKIPRL